MPFFYFLVLLLSLTVPSFSAEISVKAKISPQKIGLSENAVFSIEVHNARISPPAPPKVPGLHFEYSGTSSSSSINMINGKFSSLTVHSYNFTVFANKTGKYTIPALNLQIRGKNYQTSALTLTVLKKPQKHTQQQNSGSLLDQFFGRTPEIPSLYLRLYPKKESVYQNQALIVDLLVFSQKKESMDYQLIEANPLRSDRAIVYDISKSLQPDKIQLMKDQVGNLYYGKIYRKYVIFPIDKGQIALRSPRIVAVSPFGQLEVKGENIRFQSLKVGDQAGVYYIGDLDLSWENIPDTVESGKTLDLTVNMRGSGNLRILSNPYGQVRVPGVFLSTPRSEVRFDSMQKGKAYFVQKVSYTLMAQKEGHFRIPDLKIEGYDDQMKPFTKKLKGFEINVISSKNAQKETREIGKPVPIEKKRNFHYLLFHPFVLFLLILSFLLPPTSFFVGKHLEKLKTNPEYARKIKATQLSNHYLTKAREHLKNDEIKLFYHELESAVLKFLTDKFGLPRGIRIGDLKEALKNKLSDHEVTEIIDFIRFCEKNSYGMNANAQNALSSLEKAVKLLSKVRRKR